MSNWDLSSRVEAALENFNVDGTPVPVAYLEYFPENNENNVPFIVYGESYLDSAMYADDEIQLYSIAVDFCIYSKGSSANVFSELKNRLEIAGFRWLPKSDHPAGYNVEQGLYQKVYSFHVLEYPANTNIVSATHFAEKP